MNKLSKKISLYFIFFISFSIYLSYWIYYTNTYYNEEALQFFYYPILKSLVVLDYFSWDGISFLLEGFDSWYPTGVLIFPISIYSFGLSNLILKFPWVLNLALGSLFLVIPFLFLKKKEELILYFFLFLTNPLIIISIKSFSAHSWIIAFCLISFL